MKLNKDNFLSSVAQTNYGAYCLVFLALIGELLLLTTLFTTYSHSLDFLNTVFIGDMPIVGVLRHIDPDLSMSHIICLLLAVFSVVVPVIILHIIKKENLFQHFAEWASYPGNKVMMALLGFLLFLVIAIEVTAFYTMISAKNEAAQGGFVTAQPASGIEAYLRDNEALGVLISIVVVTVNCALAYASVWAFDNLKKAKGV